MIRLVFLLRRKSGMSLPDFQRYWRDEHGPLVASFQTRLGILRYVQVHTLEDAANAAAATARGGMETPYDGVAELWWDSEEALGKVLATGAGRAAGATLLEDEKKFIDLANSPLYLTHEYPQVNPSPEPLVARPCSPLVKLYFPLRQHAQLSFEAAQRYWRTAHGPLIRSQAHAMGILRYQQVHRFETPLEDELRKSRGTVTAPYLGHAEVWFDRTGARSGPEVAEAGRRAIEDEAKFIDFKRSAIWIAKERVFIDRI
jgi:uncharacterized protein (TIGR02118 family)